MKAILIVIISFTSNVYAFKPFIHADDITSPALSEIEFDKPTILRINRANMLTDIYERKDDPAHADNNELAATSTRLDSRRNVIIEKLRMCKRYEALENLGQVLHTVQDIYSHTNAVDNGFVGNLTGEGILHMANGSAVCDGITDLGVIGRIYAPGGLVSGFFNYEGWKAGVQNINPTVGPVTGDDGSCEGFPNFGIPGVSSNDCCHRDLNKDNNVQINGANTFLAQNAAYFGTKNYIQQIYNLMGEDYPDQAEFLKNMLRNKQKKVVYVIDTTGSMEDDLALHRLGE